MCGIAGIISSNANNVTTRRLQAMTDSIHHRGPEGDGFWINKTATIGIGHRRLSIIDLTNAGHQPMHYLHRYTITYNGEIYNYPELKQHLIRNDYAFTSECDTEVILAAYDYYGKDCVQHFDGMFAFAIWDDIEQLLFCARDRFGEKPFYYYDEGTQFLFGSEMKALWAAGIAREMDDTMLLNYITLGLTSDPSNMHRTFFKKIYNLPPAHYFELRLQTPAEDSHYVYEILPYWHLDKESQAAITEAGAIETFEALLQTSVKRRLRSDVAVGTSLSGGLDSSSIVASIHEFIQRGPAYKQTGFSAIFPGFEKDESRQIREVSEKFSLINFSVTPTAEELVNDFEKLAYHQEEPFQSASIYAQYKVYELAAKHGITVLLDGQGADEILAGYHKYYHWYWQELLGTGNWKKFRAERKLALASGVNDEWSLKNYIAAYLPGVTAKQLEKRAYRQQEQHADLEYDFFLQNYNRNALHKPVTDKLNDILYFNTMQLGLGDLLRYADRNSMAHSREVRLPFLNHELVQFIFSLPAHFKINQGWTKWILRATMQHKLPAEIVWRKDKVGFEPPQKQWLHNKQLQEYIHEAKKKLVNKGILKKTVFEKAVVQKSAHEKDNFDWRYLCAASCI